MSSNPFRKAGGGGGNSSTSSSQGQNQGLGLGLLADRFPAIDAIDTSVVAHTPPPPVSFRASNGPGASSSPDPLAAAVTGQKKPKVVKKVRVQSPPPLSPDSPEWPFHPPPQLQQPTPEQLNQTFHDANFTANGDHVFRSSAASDLFTNNTSNSDPGSTAPLTIPTPPPPQQQQQPHGGTPANPFSKTLEDLENARKLEDLKEERREEGAALKVGNLAARGSLNVDAFQRLLMTGQKGDVESSEARTLSPSAQTPPSPERSRASSTPSKLGQDNRFENVTDGKAELQDEDEESDSSTTVQVWERRKAPPPPPSSRHGKSIKPDDLRDESTVTSPFDIDFNKPLPPEPPNLGLDTAVQDLAGNRSLRSKFSPADGDSERPPTPSSGKKSVPAPPPRRGHSRGESKLNAPATVISPKELPGRESPSRSSIDSATSPPNSRQSSHHAPAPPPPRRGHGSRPVSFQPLPTADAFLATTNQQQSPPPSHSPEQIDKGSSLASTPSPPRDTPSSPDPTTGQTKPSAPPPPPARSASTRRPPSVTSIEPPSSSSSSRQVSGGAQPPPPPPTRRRGNSKSSMEGPPPRTSADYNRVTPGVPEEPSQDYDLSGTADVKEGHGQTILADLDALQREVDALRGKLG